jgi:hypothetical protein
MTAGDSPGRMPSGADLRAGHGEWRPEKGDGRVGARSGRWRALVIPLFVTSLAGYTSGDQKSGTWTCAVPGWARAG